MSHPTITSVSPRADYSVHAFSARLTWRTQRPEAKRSQYATLIVSNKHSSGNANGKREREQWTEIALCHHHLHTLMKQ